MNRVLSTKLVLTAVACATLAACGGGGTTGPLIRPDEPSTPTAWVNPAQSVLTVNSNGDPITSKVLVGVVDSGFLVDHFEIKDQITASANFGGTATMADDILPHGTSVAQIIAGEHVGYSGNSSLLLAKVADGTGTMFTTTVSQGAIWTMDNGAKVLNASLGYMWWTGAQHQKDIYNKAVQTSTVVVMSANNDNENLSTIISGNPIPPESIFSAGNTAMKDVSLIVGALDGNNKASYSNYAGDSADVQSRFIVANGTNYVQPNGSTEPATSTGGLDQFSGTSSAAPVVAAAAAQILAYWPAMTAEQTSKLLLDTANKTFNNLYSLNTCGTSGVVNCGRYYFGEGKLDLQKAMQPVGPTSIPTGAGVNGSGSYAVAATSLTLPAAFGDSLTGQTLNAAFFDGFGRDFGFNLLSRVGVASTPRMTEVVAQGLSSSFVDAETPAMKTRFQFGSNGALLGSAVNLNFAGHSFSFTNGKGSSSVEQVTKVPLLGLQGSGALSSYDKTQGIGASFNLGNGVATHARLMHGQTTSMGVGEDAAAVRYEAGLAFNTGESTKVTAGVSTTSEGNAMLGRQGSGALALSGSTGYAASLKIESNLGQGWNAFGYTELGTMQVMGNGLASLSGVRTSQFGAGLQWTGEDGDQTFGFAVSQPVRVEKAIASFNTPTGRTLDGQVVYESKSIELSPSGRQVNIDLGFQQRLDKSSTLRVNALLVRDSGHMKGKNDSAIALGYRKTW